MESSVPTTSAVQASFAATLFDEWSRLGLRDVVLGPGSRSTPLALASASCAGLHVEVRIDERGAGFFALGRALATRRPVALVVTSGTAAAELHPAIAEADLAGVPLLVVTADRPPELHGVGAAQTIDQLHLYGVMVRRFDDGGVPRLEAQSTWRPLAARLWRAASGIDGVPGPVHLNVPFVEPLVSAPAPLPAGRLAGRPWRTDDELPVASASVELRGQRVLAVVGRGVSGGTVSALRGLGWAVIGDATAVGTLAHADPLLRHDEFARQARPDVVVRLGGAPASRSVAHWIAAWGVPVIAWRGAGPVSDPDGLVERSLPGWPDVAAPQLVADASYASWWEGASDGIERLFDGQSGDTALDEVIVARSVVQAAGQADAAVVVGSSMPVRDVEWWAPARTTPTFANRGANGIDGVVSTVLGVAAGGRAVGLVGDITLRHDLSGLADGLGPRGGSCALVVVDNGGGGIFSFLSQATAVEPASFERLFATPRTTDVAAVSRSLGLDSGRVATAGDLDRAIAAALERGGLSVIVADVPDRSTNVARHEEYARAAAAVAATAAASVDP
ncbi:MAG: 2-succinyl-5-enolpyruvyl-6-hydroxy-3-cyclohexene-1-carboxylic-acid synthase [Acidimicrobiales bacterium]